MSILAEISIIIPVGPGDESWKELLGDLRALPSETEIIVVKSVEVTTEDLAIQSESRLQMQFIRAPHGRAQQLNTGAAVSTKRFLWFVHADSRIPRNSLTALEKTLQFSALRALFHFDLRFSPDGPKLVALNEWGAMLRASLLGLPFGDQGFCIERALFDELGGFETKVSCGEDHLFVWACKFRGIPTFRINAPLYTSARRYRDHGWLRTTARHFAIVVSQILMVRRSPSPARTKEEHA